MQGWSVKVVTSDGSEATFPVTPKVLVDFERFYKVGVGKAFQDEQRLEHVYWLAWKAAHAAGEQVTVFDTWLDTVVSVDLDTESVPFDGNP